MTGTIKAELEAVRTNNGDGILKPAEVIEFARDPSTALNGRFEWDDEIAGHLYRIEQAEEVIRTVKVEIVPNDSSTAVTVRAYVSLSAERCHGGGYRRTIDVMTNDEHRDLMLGDALTELRAFRLKYKHLKILAPLFEVAAHLEKAGE